MQFKDPTYAGGANKESLEQARENFSRIGVSAARYLNVVRKPLPSEYAPAKLTGRKREVTPLELALRRNRGIRLRPKLIEVLSGFEKFAESNVVVSFSTLIEADDDLALISRMLSESWPMTFRKRWPDLHEPRLFFEKMGSVYNDELCHVSITDSKDLGSIIVRQDVAIHHALDLAVLDKDAAIFILDNRSSCFSVELVDDFDFKGIEAIFSGPCIEVARQTPDLRDST